MPFKNSTVGFTESLNISVSAAIILQHTTNALRKSEIHWQLTPNELLEKRWDWTKTIKSFDEIFHVMSLNSYILNASNAFAVTLVKDFVFLVTLANGIKYL